MAENKSELFQKGFKAGVKASKKDRPPRQPIHQMLTVKRESPEYFSRQIEYEDLFTQIYGQNSALKPPYLPSKMYEIYEDCGVLKSCVEAMVQNIDGFGWEILPRSGTEADKLDEEGKAESESKKKLEEFFQTPNGMESFTAIKKQVRRDFFVTGNGYIEVVRNLKKEPQLLFWTDAKRIRLCPLEDREVQTTIAVLRGGKWLELPFRKKFRKYLMVLNPSKESFATAPRYRYFKEYRDPRRMDANTGMYWGDDGAPSKKDWVEASELVHFKHGNGTYGIPPWIGEVLDALGLPKAQYINYDLFDSQGIPPLIISIMGGQLTEESMTDLLNLFQKAKGAENFHKLLVLEAESTGYSLQDKEATPKLNIQSMNGYRKDDLLFQKYMADVRKAICMFGFRLPSMFLGEYEQLNYASARVVRETTEEQVFAPERKAFDELINQTLVHDLGVTDWVFKSRQPFIRSNDELIKLVPTLINAGVYSIQELIEFTNEHFGTNIRPYTEEDGLGDFTKKPIPLVIDPLYNYGRSGDTNQGDNDG